MIYFGVDMCGGLAPAINILKNVVKLIQFGVPIILIIYGMMDLGKAVMAGKEDEMKKAQSTLIKRVIYAVAVFLVVTIVMFVMNIVAEANTGGDTDSWWECWSQRNSNNDVDG